MARNLQPTLVRGAFGVALSVLAIGGATAQAIAGLSGAEPAARQCTAVTPEAATLCDAAPCDVG